LAGEWGERKSEYMREPNAMNVAANSFGAIGGRGKRRPYECALSASSIDELTNTGRQ
jgi:hypothetical protein